MTTHVELQHRLATDAPQRNRVLTAMHYFTAYDGMQSMTSREIADALIKARVPRAKKINVSAVLGDLVPRVDRLDETRKGARLWIITDTGKEYLRDALGLLEPEPGKGKAAPAASADAAELETLAAKVADADVRDYLDEAAKCLRAGARRAAVVFVWTGAVATLRDKVWLHGAPAIDAAIKVHRPKASDFT